MQLKYRPEIDGLRAIAVLAVVFYHAEFLIFGHDYFKGGFLGVDIFFVISGYLITSIILKELEANNRFSIVRFYERRARRILPALFFVLIACIPFAWMYMLPKAMKEFAGSGLSSLFFGSNIWFWKEDSYVAEASALKPLLHTWTLSLEEQFYIFFPVILMLAWKFCRKYVLGIFIVLFLISLQASNIGSQAFVDANFYLLPTRGWELLAGSILAKLELGRERDNPDLLTQILPPIGLFLILVSIFTFNDEMRHPAYMTLIPIIGTMLIIRFSARNELTTDILSLKPMVGIGLISYSLYLWHFPFFAFGRIIGGELSELSKWSLTFASILAGVLSYYFIEKATRKNSSIPRKPFLVGCVFSFLILTLGYGNIYLKNGVPSRLGPVAKLFEGLERPSIRSLGAKCYVKHPTGYCEIKRPNSIGSIISVGDSHADALGAALIDTAKLNNMNYIKLSRGGCPYVWRTYIVLNGKTKNDCGPDRSDQVRNFLKSQPPSVVVMTNNFPYYLSNEHFDNREGGKITSTSNYVLTRTDLAVEKNLSLEVLMRRTVSDVLNMGHKVVLVYPIPEAGWDVPEHVQKELRQYKVSKRFDKLQELNLTTSYAVVRKRRAATKKVFDEIPNHPRLRRIKPAKAFCSNETQRCKTYDGERLLYFDSNHVSYYGAKLITKRIERKMRLISELE